MGQCKSKTNALDNGLHEDTGSKEKKVSRRKWRKRKGYSLSASLEGDLNRDAETIHSASRKSPKNGPVLVSYNLTRGENDILESFDTSHKPSEPQRRNSCDHLNLSNFSPITRTDLIITEENTEDNNDNDEDNENAAEHVNSKTPATNDTTANADAALLKLDNSLTKYEINTTSYQLETVKNVEPPKVHSGDVESEVEEEAETSDQSKTGNCSNTFHSLGR